jgi:superfamily II DNA or RNA helicase
MNSPTGTSGSLLTRNGYIVQSENESEIKRELTVRPQTNALGSGSGPGFGPSFKVFRQVKGERTLVVPRYYGLGKFGPPARDTRPACAGAPGIVFTGRLRDATRQNEAFAAGTKAFEETGGGVLSLFCGGGKTTVALALSAQLKVRTMIVVHKEFLANQWVDKIKEFCPGATIGRVQGDTFNVEKDFVIAMIQTMCMREFDKKAFDSIGLLVVDEAHHIGAPAFSQFMFKVCPRYTLGLTATPERKDGLTRLLYWFLGPEFFKVERVNQGTTKVTTLNYTDQAFKESPPVTRFGQLNMAGMINIVTELEARNDLIVQTAEEALADGRRVLVLSDRREHCFYLQNRLGSNAKLYVGGMKEKDLEESAKSPIVVATFQLAHEGLDIPALDTVILATPKSDIKQSIGRIMRETPKDASGARAGKLNDPLIFDIADQWSVFFAMYRKRLKVYREGGFEISSEATEDAKPTEVFGKGKCLF